MNELFRKMLEYLGELGKEISTEGFGADFFARFVVIWTLISRIPLPQKWWPTKIPHGNRVLSASPLAGAVLGLLNGVFVILLLRLGMKHNAASWLGVALYSLCGWTLHLDGWGDLWDGIGSGKCGDGLRSVMKDSRLGACGAIGLILAVGLWSSLVAAVSIGRVLAACVVAAGCGRLASCSAACFGYYPWESGMAKGWVDAFTGYDLFFACVSTLLLLPFAPIELLFSAIIAILIGFGLARQMNSRLGGVNGDILGAAAVAAEILSLVVFMIC